MKHIFKYLAIFCLTCLSFSLSAQQAKQSFIQSKQRRIAAKLLLELDRTPKANNRNNGKSNRDRCCNDGVAAPSNYQVLVFGLNTSWYLWQLIPNDDDYVGIPNPIPYLQSISSSWEVALYKENEEFVMNKSGYLQNNELLISIADLPKGKYFIEIEHGGDYYATGFSIGIGKQVPTSNIHMNKNE